jgi:hypothetical protein
LGKLGQQLGLDALHREVGDAGHALHGLRDGQDVARADRAVRVAEALEGVALQRRLRLALRGGDRQVVEAARVGHLEQPLVHPAAGRDVLERIADRHVVAPHHALRRDVGGRHLVPLRHLLAQLQAGRQQRPFRQAAVVRHDGHVVGLVHADQEGRRRHLTPP